jgi:hypothetical protein
MAPLDPTTRLSIAELVIYIVLAPVVIYNLLRHGKSGFLGWGFLIVFCGLRLAADGIQIENHDKAAKGEPVSDVGAIVNAIGISGLLYSLSGIIHEWSGLLTSPQALHLSLTMLQQLPPHSQPRSPAILHHPNGSPPPNHHWHRTLC